MRRLANDVGQGTWTNGHRPGAPRIEQGRRPRAKTKESARRTKVLHVITRFMDGSGGNTLLTAVGTDPVAFEVWVVSSPGGPLWERAEKDGIIPVKLPRFREVLSPLDDLVVLWQLFRLIRRERFAIVHTHSSKAGVLGRLAAWLARTPVVIHTIHGFSWHDFMSRRRRRFYITVERLVGRITDVFIAVAPAIAREAREKAITGHAEVVVVPSAVELDAIPRMPDSSLRHVLGISPDATIVGSVGRVDFQKAPADFISMALAVSGSHPTVQFVWIGGGTMLEEMRAVADACSAPIHFLGYRDDAATLAAGFDVYVVSSLYEGLGRALTEAMASGRPVAATAVNGVVDIVEDGVTGLLSPAADPLALAANVVWLIDHPREAEALGDEARYRVRRLFQPRIMCRQIDQVYQRGLARPLVSLPAVDWEFGEPNSEIAVELHLLAPILVA